MICYKHSKLNCYVYHWNCGAFLWTPRFSSILAFFSKIFSITSVYIINKGISFYILSVKFILAEYWITLTPILICCKEWITKNDITLSLLTSYARLLKYRLSYGDVLLSRRHAIGILQKHVCSKKVWRLKYNKFSDEHMI